MYELQDVDESTPNLLEACKVLLYEAVREDIKAHPGGVEGFAAAIGIDVNTARCWWNPRHGRRLCMARFVELLLVSPGTHTKKAITDVADMCARQRERIIQRKLQKLTVTLNKIQHDEQPALPGMPAMESRRRGRR